MKVVRFSLFSIAFLVVNQAFAISVDLSTWTDDTFLNTGGQSNWVVQNAPTNDEVEQTVNGLPTVFYDPNVNAQGTALSGRVQVTTTGDDDFIGFVLGYNAGELESLGAAGDGFFLVDWKQGNQSNPFGACGAAAEAATLRLSTAQQSARWIREPRARRSVPRESAR